MEIGKTYFDKYKIIEEIGTGGFGVVYLAEEGYGRQVAIKTLRPELSEEYKQEARDRFEREIRIGLTLNHPHILKAHTYEKDDEIYLVMAYMPGGSLADWLDRLKNEDQLPNPQETIAYIRQICQAVNYLYKFNRKGYIHRDITPNNILLDADGNARLMDFGLIQEPGSSTLLYSQGKTASQPGTPMYQSPEARTGGSPLRATSDIYMLGAVLFELLTGWPYFHQQDASPGELRPEIPPELDAVVLKAVAENPKDRYQSAIKFDAALEQVEKQLLTRELDKQDSIQTETNLPAHVENKNLIEDIPDTQKATPKKPNNLFLFSNLRDTIKTQKPIFLGIASVLMLSIVFFAIRAYTPSIVSSSPSAISADSSLSATIETTTPKPTITKSLTPTPTTQKTSTPKPTVTKTKTPEPTATPIPFLSINTETMNIRSGPGTDYDIVDKAKQDETFTVAAQTDDGDWYRLSGSDEQWVSAGFVEITGDPPVTQDIPPTPPPINSAFLPYGEFETIWNKLGGRTGSLGDPTSSVTTNVECTREKFEHGIAVWLRPINLPLGTGYFGVYGAQSYIVPDTWQEGMASRTCNLTSAVRGFNKTLCEYSQIRIALGNPIEAESGNSNAIIQEFQKGIIIYSPIDQKIMVFFNNNTWQDNL